MKFTPDQVRICCVLKMNGVSIRKIADKTGISRAHVHRIVTGQRRQKVKRPKPRAQP